jgi:hypothetical protein
MGLLLLAVTALTVLAVAGIRLQVLAYEASTAVSAGSSWRLLRTEDSQLARLGVFLPRQGTTPAEINEELWTEPDEIDVADYQVSADDYCRPPASLRQVRRDLRQLELFPAGEGKLHTPHGELTVMATAPVLLRYNLFPDAQGHASHDCFWDVGYGTYVQVFDRKGKETACLGPFDRAMLTVTTLPDKQQQARISKMLGGTFLLEVDAAGAATVRAGESGHQAAEVTPYRASLVEMLRRKPITKADRYSAFD